MLCGFYLLYLGTKMLIHPRRNQEAEQKDIVFQRPFFDGLTLSLLNPKSYPVMISVIGAVLAAQSDLLAWNHYAFIFATSVTGFILGYTTMVFSAGTSIVTRITQHYFQWMMMVFGLIFIGFGFHLLWTTITNSAP
jgi:threonine/homoserine/homoserine lactone efflux protein